MDIQKECRTSKFTGHQLEDIDGRNHKHSQYKKFISNGKKTFKKGDWKNWVTEYENGESMKMGIFLMK